MRVLSIFGTRPEAIKMAPVVKALEDSPKILSRICVTGQHRAMLDQALDFFDLHPDYDLNIMRKNQHLTDLTSTMLVSINKIIEKEKPDRVLVHGDTTTALAATLASFYSQIPVGHIEAGLRTGDINRPYPEELNRKLIDSIADMLFAPTKQAKQNLMAEGISEQNIFVTGNTIIDALLHTTRKLDEDPRLAKIVGKLFPYPQKNKKLILVTGHRRESFGDGLKQICVAMKNIATRNDIDIVYPVHLNPNVQKIVTSLLNGFPNIHLLEPLDYPSFVYAMKQAYLIISDSGGIQEEAPTLGKPVLLMRDTTERPEAVSAGAVKLVGANTTNICREAIALLDNTDLYTQMAEVKNPYGDGFASSRILQELLSNA